MPFQKVRRAIGMGGDKLMPFVAGISEDSSEGRRISKSRSEIFKADYLPHLKPFSRVRELLERLRADDFTLAVASSAKDDELKPLLEIAGAADLIAGRTSSDGADRSKPDPDIVEAAIDQAHGEQDRTILLGDTPYDAEAALRAGIAFVGVECGGWTREDLKSAVEVYAAPAEILARYEASVFAHLRFLTARTS